MRESGTQTHLILDNSEIVETFEALCSIPFVETYGQEPEFKRELRNQIRSWEVLDYNGTVKTHVIGGEKYDS